jgi:hypothetical protein
MINNLQEHRKDTKNGVKNLTKHQLKFAFGGSNKVFTPAEKCTKNELINLSQLIELIKSDAPSNAFKIREIVQNGFNQNIDAKEIKTQIKPLKNSLPFVLFSGFCPLHHNDNNLVYNGCLQLDIDFKFIGGNLKAIELKEVVKDLPFVLLAAISPSGYGLKCLIATDNFDVNLHGKVSKAIINEVSELLSIDKIYFDNLGASQPCFVPYDRDVYFNKNYTPYNAYKALYNYNLEQQRKEAQQRLIDSQTTIQTSFDSDNITTPQIEKLKYLTAQILASNIDITDGYKTWFAVACAYASLGENGRSLFHSVASLNAGYDYSKNDRKFNEGLKKNGGSIGYLVNVCKGYNITINEFCRNWIKENAPKNNYFNGSGTTQKTCEVKKYTLKSNEYIGNILTARSFKLGINILLGSTGTGKTNFTAQNFAKTIVVSRNITTLENYSKYGFERFQMKDAKDNFCGLEDGSKISVTYKSLEKMLNKFDTSDCVFVFDEYHLLTDSYSDVRKETQFSYNILESLQKTNVVILASANDVLISDKRIKIVSKHVFNKPTVKRFVDVTYNSNFNTLKAKVLQRLQEGRKVLLYTNRKDDKAVSEFLAAAFADYSILFFDATKHHIDLEDLQTDITVCTKALTTGKDVLNSNLAMMIFCDDYDTKRSVINQFFGRARDYKTATFDLLFTINYDNEKYKEYDINNMIFGCNEIAKSVISASVNDIAFLHENQKYFVAKDNDKMIINYFAIDNHIETQISLFTLRNTNLLSEFLKLHGYDCTIAVESDTDIEKVEKSGLSDLEKYFNEINLINDGNESDYIFETTAQNRVNQLMFIGFSKKESLLYSLRYDSPQRWKIFVNYLLCEIRLETDNSFIRDYNKILECLNYEFLTALSITEKIKKLGATKTIIGRDIAIIKKLDSEATKTQRFVLKTLRKYFVVEPKNIDKTRLFAAFETDYLTEKMRVKTTATDIKNLQKISKFI